MLLNPGSLSSRMGGGGRSIFSDANATGPMQGFDPNPMNQLSQLMTNTSIPYRCMDLQAFIARTSLDDLRKCFPMIIDNIFGFGQHLGWGLRALTRRESPREMEATEKLLGPEGILIQLSYRLMAHDPLLRYEFSLHSLPVSIERHISQNDVPGYFPKNIRFKYAALTTPYALLLNPFEYFIYVFTSVLVGNRSEQSTYIFGWQNLTESVYTILLEDFLQYFLPINGRAVPPIPQDPQPRAPINYMSSHLVSRKRIPGRFSYPLSPQGSRVPKLFRPTILDDESYVIASRNMSLSQEYSPMERENWRSETIVNAFIIMWMHIDCSEGILSAQFETILPNVEMVKSVRMIVRHFHFFNNVVNATVMHPLEEIKKFLFPLFQKRLYVFLRYLFKHWPMDHSFRLIYETWLSYIQPWRYINLDQGVVRDREDVQIDQRWSSFISDNVVFYTYLLQDILVRIAKSDLSTYRNAHMLFRITKIFTSQRIIKPTLKSLDSNLAQLSKPPPVIHSTTPSVLKKRGNAKINLNASSFNPRRVSFSENSFSAANSSSESYFGQIPPSPYAVSSSKFEKFGTTFRDLEYNKGVYVPLFSPNCRDMVRTIIQNMDGAKESCEHYISAPNVQGRPSQRFFWIKAMFFPTPEHRLYGPTPNTILEKEKVLQFLDATRGALAGFFDLTLPEEINGGSSSMNGISSVGQSTNGIDSFGIPSPPRLTPVELQEMKTIYVGYKGHPDFAPVRADENTRAVRILHNIAALLNAIFGEYIRDNYLENNKTGKIIRALVAKPQFYEVLQKRGPGDKTRLKKCLSPRILLRPLGSSAALLNAIVFLLIGCMFKLEGLAWFFAPLGIYLLYIILRASFEPRNSLAKLREEFEGRF